MTHNRRKFLTVLVSPLILKAAGTKLKITFKPWTVILPDGWERTAGGCELTGAARNYINANWESLTHNNRPEIAEVEEV